MNIKAPKHKDKEPHACVLTFLVLHGVLYYSVSTTL